MVAQRAIDSTFAIYGQPDAAPALPPTSFPDVPATPTPEEFEEDEPHEGVIDGEFTPNEGDWDPFAEEAAPAQAAPTPEEEVDAALVEIARQIGQPAFRAALAKHNIAAVRNASFDQKVLLLEDLQKGRAA